MRAGMREPSQTISYYKAGGPAHVPLSQAARLNPLDESAAPFGRAWTRAILSRVPVRATRNPHRSR